MFEVESLSIQEAKLERLHDVLSQSFWDFSVSLDDNSFDGISEGVCIMIGIFPEGSMRSQNEYGPRFLPCGLESFDYSVAPKGSEQMELRDKVQERARRLTKLKLSGTISVKGSMEFFAGSKIHPPWLDVARSDVRFATHIPEGLLLTPDMKKMVKRAHSSDGGHARAENNQITKIMREDAYPIFCELREAMFEGCCAMSTGRPVATRIAKKVREQLKTKLRQKKREQCGAHTDVQSLVVPVVTTVEENVRKWMKKNSVS